MTLGRVLIVEDDAEVRAALEQTLELAEYDVTATASFVEAKDLITPSFPGVIISDIRMPGRDGMFLLDYAHKVDADLPVILLTGEGDIPMAVDAMSRGAFDFLEKPCPPDQILAAIARAGQARRLVLENRALKAELAKGDAADRIIFGVSPQAAALRDRVRQLAPYDSPVLIEGAPGTGMPKIASVLHLLSPRADAPFQKRAAADLSPTDLTRAFAKGGVLFLDEIGDLPGDAQFALIDLLEGPAITRLLVSTSRDLTQSLKPDLYHMLQALRVRIPPLRERPEDIPHMFRRYVAQACEQAGIPERDVDGDTIAHLMAQDWPGNARALMNAAMRFALGLDQTAQTSELGLTDRMAQIEASLLSDALRRAEGRATKAAEALKLPRKTFYDKLAKYNLRPEDYR